MPYGAEVVASSLLTSLTQDVDFTIPTIDITLPEFNVPNTRLDGGMYKIVEPVTVEQLTEKKFDGTGVFDQIMAGYSAHLEKEFKANRITGAEYTKAFVALAQGAMGNAVQFLLQKDDAFWRAQTAQIQAITARIQNETAKAQMMAMQYEAHNAKSTYALTKLKLAGEDMQFGMAKYNLDNTLPAQLANLQAQRTLLSEQVEAHRAQTLNTRIDGTPIAGTLGKQRELYDQQIVSYKRDAEVKAARLFTDAWITMKTIDEGLLPPAGFANASVDTVLNKLKTNNGLT